MSNTLIVEPNEFVRKGLCACLAESEYDVIAAVQTIASGQLPETLPHPELVILGSGTSENLSAELEGLRLLKSPGKEFRLVLMLDLAVKVGMERFETFGFDALLSRDVTSEVLVRSLELVMLGQQIFPMFKPSQNGFNARQVETVPDSAKAPPQWRSRTDIALSEREMQALRGLIAGESNKLIAQRLFVSEPTIKARIKSLLRKIGAANRTQAALWAIQNPDICNVSPQMHDATVEN